MSRLIHLLLLSLVAGALAQGCAIENEYDEKIIIPDENNSQHQHDERENTFMDLCKKCVLGDFDELNTLRNTYFQSFRDRSFTPRFLFQREEFNSYYESCIHKAVSEGKADNSINYMIIGPYSASLIAREMYAENRAADGAFWIRRVINLQGRKNGYEIAGSIFIRNEKTYNIGVKMLGESAHLGNFQAYGQLYDLSTNADGETKK
ncbi:MAG: hypothetical protein J6M93_04825 [Succinivibrio sp.]|nr:hypothetical protein [Succinivibrio sp.]